MEIPRDRLVPSSAGLSRSDSPTGFPFLNHFPVAFWSASSQESSQSPATPTAKSGLAAAATGATKSSPND